MNTGNCYCCGRKAVCAVEGKPCCGGGGCDSYIRRCFTTDTSEEETVVYEQKGQADSPGQAVLAMPKPTTRTYHLRGDFVMVRAEARDKIGAVAVSQTSPEGRKWTIAGFGPEVEGLTIGQEVVLFADKDVMYFSVPGEKDLVIIRGRYISAVVEESEG